MKRVLSLSPAFSLPALALSAFVILPLRLSHAEPPATGANATSNPAAPAVAPSTNFGKATLTGRVVLADGRPAAGVTVTAIMQQKFRWQYFKEHGMDYGRFDEEPWRSRYEKFGEVLGQSTVTDAKGNYTLKGLTTAPYNINFVQSHNKYGGFYRTFGEWVAPAVEGAWAKEGQTVRRSSAAVMTHGAIIEGTVVDKATGKPLAGVMLAYNGPQFPKSADGVMGVTSDAYGHIAMRVPPGTYEMYIAGPAENSYSGKSRYVDTGERVNSYGIRAQSGVYAGSGSMTLQTNGATLDLDLGWNKKIKWTVAEGEEREFVLQLRRLELGEPKRRAAVWQNR